MIDVGGSSWARLLDIKREVNRRSEVHEYIVWRTYDEALDWFVLREGQYVPLAPEDGLLKSSAFPGLWLDSAALLKRDLAAVLAALARGIAYPEHAVFVQKLASQRKA